jgi:hypothetical protein
MKRAKFERKIARWPETDGQIEPFVVLNEVSL